MRARRSLIRPLELLPSLLAPRSVVPLYLDPRSRTRRRAAVFGSGARASSVRRCDGVSSRTRGRPRAVAAVPKAGRGSPGLGLLVLSPGGRGAQPYAARASGASSRSPQISIQPAGVSETKGRSVHVAILSEPELFFIFPRSARDRLVLAACQITAPREAAREFKGHRGQRPVLGGARGRRGAPDAPTPRRRLARHQNLGPPS